MSLPTRAELETMDYSYLGSPFVWIAGTDGESLETMDYSYLGSPFVIPVSGGSPPAVTTPMRSLMGCGT